MNDIKGYGIVLIMSKVKKIIKVLARKAQGLDRKAKLQEMKRGLLALNLIVCRQKRDQGFSFMSFEDIDAVDLLLKRASVRR